VLDSTSSSERVHSGVDILVEMETLLSFGDSSSSVHEDGVEEIRVTVVKLSSDPGQSSSREGSERLFLSGGDVSEDSDVYERQKEEARQRTKGEEGKRKREGEGKRKSRRRDVERVVVKKVELTLRENVLSSSKDSDRSLPELGVAPLSVRRLRKGKEERSQREFFDDATSETKRLE